MNKKFMIGGCAAVAIAGNVFAADEDYSYFAPYASLKGGYAFLGKRNDIKYKGGFAGAVELGVSYDAWRLGLELGYKSNKIKDFKFPGGFEGTNYVLNGGFDCGNPATANIVNHNTGGAGGAEVNAATAAIGEYSVFNVNGNGAGVGPVFGVAPSANGQQTLGLKNVTEFKFEKMSAMTGMINVFYDYAMTDAWSIYGGIGLGAARVNLTVSKRDSGVTTGAKKIGAEKGNAAGAYTVADAKKAVLEALPKFFDDNDAKWIKTELSKTVFAWQLMAGVGYEFNENWKLTLGYKLFNTAKVKQNIAGKEYKIKTPFNHTAELGLTYTF
jgi:opacity protein-like surface antigen